MDRNTCIKLCLECHRVCLGQAFTHCLRLGGSHVVVDHFRLMAECAELCRTAAYFMSIGSPRHPDLCRTCANVCRQCAASCADLAGMADCVEACCRCAVGCEEMAAA